MPGVVVVGLQWGDEGKGKVVDLLAARAQVVARYSGGANAGHTVINDLGSFKLHQVPSGIFNPDCLSILGNGVVISPRLLCNELDYLESHGISLAGLRISERAHVVMPYHPYQESLDELARGSEAIGTTGNGIGPAYMDKVGRNGIQMADFVDGERFASRLASVIDAKNRQLLALGGSPTTVATILEELEPYRRRLAPFVTETGALVRRVIRDGGRVLLEGAQATLLDVDHGTYPFVTSSNPVASSACTGVGIGPTAITDVIGILKAYSSRVGAGPFPTELLDATGERIREIGQEYGTTTGRPRRCGWLDTVVARYAAEVNGITRLAVTRLDILDDFDEIKICVAYDLDGRRVETLPASSSEFARCLPIYETMPGWRTPTSEIRTFRELPIEARHYLDRISELLDTSVDIIGVGAKRGQSIVVGPLP